MLEAKAGDHDAARAKFAQGLALEPGNAFVCHAWGQLELSQGHADAARAIYTQALAMGPQPQVIAALADLEMAAGDYEAARELFRTGVDGTPATATAEAAAAAVENAGAAVEVSVAGFVEAAGPEVATAAVMVHPAQWAEMSATQKKNWRGRQSKKAKWAKEKAAAAAEGAGEAEGPAEEPAEEPAKGADGAAARGSSKGAAAAAVKPAVGKASAKGPLAAAAKKPLAAGAAKARLPGKRMDTAPLLRAWAALEETRFHNQVAQKDLAFFFFFCFFFLYFSFFILGLLQRRYKISQRFFTLRSFSSTRRTCFSLFVNEITCWWLRALGPPCTAPVL